MGVNVNTTARQKAFIASMALAGTLAMSAAFTVPQENIVNKAYYDVGHVATACIGETHGITIDMVLTDPQCAALFKKTQAQAATSVQRTIHQPMTPQVETAFIDFVYNAGATAFAKSSMARFYNAGDKQKACNAFLFYKYAAGKDCTIKKNNCRGLITRRLLEQEECLS